MLSPPPRDAHGDVRPHDHEGISDGDGVIRRISPQLIVDDPKTGRRLSSLAMTPSSGENGGMSVNLQNEIEQANIDARAYVSSPPWLGAVRFEAGQLRAIELIVGYDPLPGDPHHGEVWGNFSKGKKRQLLNIANWFVAIDGVSIDG